MGSRGSVIPSDISLPDGFELPIAYPRLTRFMITLQQGVDLVRQSFDDMVGGEIYFFEDPIYGNRRHYRCGAINRRDTTNVLSMSQAVRWDAVSGLFIPRGSPEYKWSDNGA